MTTPTHEVPEPQQWCDNCGSRNIVTVRDFATAEQFLDAYNAEAITSPPSTEPSEAVRGKYDDYVAWLRYDYTHEETTGTTIRVCDSDAKGAFKVYAHPVPASTEVGEDAEQFQSRVQPWMQACFGAEISEDKQERNHRFLEEALELVQACGCGKDEARQLVEYVYGRSVGDPSQEVGGVMVTLAALCLAQGLNMHQSGEAELARIWTKIDVIRRKQAAKPRNSPLPEAAKQQIVGERCVKCGHSDGLNELGRCKFRSEAGNEAAICCCACVFESPGERDTCVSVGERIAKDFADFPSAWGRKLAASIDAAIAKQGSDYEEVLADHRRLVRRLDVALNGEHASPQASLVDLVTQVEAAAIRKSESREDGG